jgi:hypothetical protein
LQYVRYDVSAGARQEFPLTQFCKLDISLSFAGSYLSIR